MNDLWFERGKCGGILGDKGGMRERGDEAERG